MTLNNAKTPHISRCAWIDHTNAYDGMFGLRIMACEIDITGASTLEDFFRDNDLNNFPVLLYHPGKDMPRLKWLVDNYPRLNIGLLTLGSSFEKRMIGVREIAVLPYIADVVSGFVKDHQEPYGAD